MKKILSLILLSLFLLTCDKDDGNQEPDDGQSTEIEIKENVIAFTEDTSQLISDDNELLNGVYVLQFTGSVPEVTLGQIVVGEHGSGYLRRVSSFTVDGNTLTMQTIQATMEDVFENGQFSFQSSIGEDSRSSNTISQTTEYNYIAEGVEVDEFGLVFDFSNTTIYQDGPLIFKITDGTATFDPNFNFDFDFESGNLEYFQFRAENATLKIDCGLQLATTGSFDLFDGTTTLVDYDRIITFFVGFVPVVVVVNTKLEAKLNVNVAASIDFNTGFVNESIIDIGATYSDGNWNGIYNAANFFTPKPLDVNNTISINQGLTIIPKVSTQIYSVVGPYVTPEMTENFTIIENSNGDWNAELKTGVRPKIGVEVEVFGNSLLDFYVDISPVEQVVYESPKNIEIISGNEQMGSQGQELQEAIKVKVTDNLDLAMSDVPVYFDVNPNDGSVSEDMVLTDSDGFAEVLWTLGTLNETQGLNVRVKKGSSDFIESIGEFTATSESLSLVLTGDLEFGNVTTIDTDVRTLTITNESMEVVNVSLVELPDGFAADWYSGSIAAAGSQDVVITFSPSEIQTYNGVITVNNDLSDTNNTIATTGNGISPLDLSGTLNFGAVMVNTTLDRNFTIINNSNQSITVSSIDVPSNFSTNWSPGAILAASSQEVILTFSPTEIQDYSSQLTVNNNVGATNNMLSISANGTENTNAVDISGFWISDIELLDCAASGTSTDPACANHATFDGLQLEFVEDLTYNFCESTSTSCGIVYNDGVYTNTEVFIERSFNFDGINLFMEIRTYSTSGFFFDTRTFNFNGVYDEVNQTFTGTYSHDTNGGLWNNLSSGNMTLTRP